MALFRKWQLLILILFLAAVHSTIARKKQFYSKSPLETSLNNVLVKFVNSIEFNALTGHFSKDSIFLDSIKIYTEINTINIYFNVRLSYVPIRENTVEKLKEIVKNTINEEYKHYEMNLYSDGKNIIDLIPNYYRTLPKSIDEKRIHGNIDRTSEPLVQNVSKSYYKNTNLYNINIALWNSHGWYYEPTLNRWEWQRARLFNTVEDLYPTSYILNYLLPMLENSGANVFLPRERHWQTNEVIIDNDSSSNNCLFYCDANHTQNDTGFAIGNPPYTIENPFKLGTSIRVATEKHGKKTVDWIPNIPESGDYPIYISYTASDQNINNARYQVYHTGGVTLFHVNQQIGGGTWVFLGVFKFEKGVNPEKGKVVLLNEGKPDQFICADAVRFGVGMGNISRNGQISKRPRYQEAARYYLQYAGFSDTLVWKQNINDDYADDRHARGEWVNYLMGAPAGPKNDKMAKGMGIPIDLTFALHTDAGTASSDSVIGTLAIYSTKEDTCVYPDGLSKMVSRDLADIIQTQVVNDIRAKYNTNWIRRDIWDKAYAEVVRPNTPSMILELLSHQNFMDVRFGKEPAFQFDVSRAIYKGMLKFLTILYNIPYIVQPLQVTHFQATLYPKGGIALKWEPQFDRLEPTANPEAYMVYTRKDNGGYDNGIRVETNEFKLNNADSNVIYSFKVTALNKGGESFPSEELSACNTRNSKGTVLILNAFDRLGGPTWFNDSTNAGFLEGGVPYMYDFITTGAQYDFNKNSLWTDDDSPGFGASYADMEDKIVPGNTFNFSFIHGKSIKQAGYSFASVSDESVLKGNVDITHFNIVDFLAGEEKTTYLPKNDSIRHYELFTDDMMKVLKKYLNTGGSLFISGAHIATDARFNKKDAEIATLLKYKWRTGNASKKGDFYFTNAAFSNINYPFKFNTGYNHTIYTVENTDALEPSDTTSKTLVRYAENNMSAGIMHEGLYKIVALGFPFETIIGGYDRDLIMEKILTFLKNE